MSVWGEQEAVKGTEGLGIKDGTSGFSVRHTLTDCATWPDMI